MPQSKNDTPPSLDDINRAKRVLSRGYSMEAVERPFIKALGEMRTIGDMATPRKVMMVPKGPLTGPETVPLLADILRKGLEIKFRFNRLDCTMEAFAYDQGDYAIDTPAKGATIPDALEALAEDLKHGGWM